MHLRLIPKRCIFALKVKSKAFYFIAAIFSIAFPFAIHL